MDVTVETKRITSPIVNKIKNNEVTKLPRRRLSSSEDALEFIYEHMDHGPILLGFFPLDDNNEILYKTKSDGAFVRFNRFERNNPSISMGVLAGELLANTFGVPSSQHFIHVIKKGKNDFELRIARFYDATGKLAINHPGKLVSLIKKKMIYRVSDVKDEVNI